MPDPRTLAERAEQLTPEERPNRETVAGYAVIGLPFASGHVLAHRRFPASSAGPGYTSIWHRDPAGDWTFYADVEPMKACNRAFGSEVSEFRPTRIDTTWTAPDRFTLEVPGELTWEIRLASTPLTRLMNAAGSLMPETLWNSEPVMSTMGVLASLLLGAGKLRLTGRVPNGQHFIANPRLIWTIPESRAVINDENLGEPGPVNPQAWLADFAVPNRGLLAFANSSFEALDETRHRAVVTKFDAPATSARD